MIRDVFSRKGFEVKAQPVVLYVEDDAQSRKLMEMLLVGRMKLQHVTILENSVNFAERVAALDPKPDVIFLDIHIQPHDGFAMLAMLRQQPWVGQRPIAAVTASVMNEEIDRLKAAGFNACLGKPLDLATFPESLERIMRGEALWRISG